jgi:hypothetical protein
MVRLSERNTSSDFGSGLTFGPRIKLPTGRFKNPANSQRKGGQKLLPAQQTPPPFINQGARIDKPEPTNMADKASKLIEKISTK